MGSSKYKLTRHKKNGVNAYPKTLVEAVFWDKEKKPLDEVLDGLESVAEEVPGKIDAPAAAGTAGQVLAVGPDGKSAWVNAATGGTYDGALSDSSTNAPQNKVVTAELTALGQELVPSSRSYAVTQGVALNTGATSLQLPVDIKQGDVFFVTLSYPEGNPGGGVTIYGMRGSTIVQNDQNAKNLVRKTYVAVGNITGIAFNITAASAIANGTATILCETKKSLNGRVSEIESELPTIKRNSTNKVDGTPSNNLFDKTAVTTGYYLQPATGLLIANANYSVSDFIPVVGGEKYSGSTILNAAWFDKYKNWIQAATVNPATAPANAAYIRLSVGNSNLNTFMFNHGESLLPYESYGVHLSPDALTEPIVDSLRETFGIGYLEQLRNHLSNPFLRTQIKLVGDSITAGLGGTGFSETGPVIPGTSLHTNVLTATCWSNMLYHYVDSVYNKENIVDVIDPNIHIFDNTTNIAYIGETVDGINFHSWRALNNNTVAGKEIMNFSFYGDHFGVRVQEGPTRGIVNVVVDGNVFTSIDLYAASVNSFSMRNVTGLTLGKHSVSIVCTNTKNASSSSNQVGITGLQIPKTAIVKPWGVGGATSRSLIDRPEWFEKDDDFVLIQIGTNDRHVTFSPDGIYENLVECGEYIRDTIKAVPIFMCASPCAENFETTGTTTRYFHMWDVHDAVVKAANHFNAPIIDNYTAFQEYAEQHEINTDALLHDGLHPNDLGYKVMFYNIMKELGLARLPYYLEWLGEN